jgi:hypothetical protein
METEALGLAGAFGVNYALRPHKFVDRRVFVEVIGRYAKFASIDKHVYVGLGSFAMEDHKLMNMSFGTNPLLSLEIDPDVLKRQKFNTPLPCIKPTGYSTGDYVVRKKAIYEEMQVSPESNSIVWFDMTDFDTIRAHLDTFSMLLAVSQPGDIVRMTVDVDEKTLARRKDDETFDALQARRFIELQEQLGPQLRPGARQTDLNKKLGIANLVCHAFRLTAEQAFERNENFKFEPISLTSYADGHRMLSVTGIVVEEARSKECLQRMDLSNVPGAVSGWHELIDIQIPQLTVWEKLVIDRKVHAGKSKNLGTVIDFKLHETVSTVELLKGYSKFQRFYPTFRHVLL